MVSAPTGQAVRSIDADVRVSVAELTKLAQRLIATPTFLPEQAINAIEIVSASLQEEGFEVERYAPVSEDGVERPFVLGWLGPRTKTPHVLLCAHIDTSPAGEGWAHAPFGATQQDGYLYGRGAAVSKSDAACFIHSSAAAWRAAEKCTGGTIVVAVTSDEGAGGDLGAAHILNELKIRPKVAIFPGSTDALGIAHNGCVQFRARIHGASSHQSSLPPAEDAMRAAVRICADIYAEADRLTLDTSKVGFLPPTLNITKVIGGTVFGMAPSEVEIWVDRRVTPAEDIESVRCGLAELLSAHAGKDLTELDLELVRLASPMRSMPEQGHFLSLLRDQAKVVSGRELKDIESPLYTDARWYSGADIPTIMYGAGESDIRASGVNAANERVPLDYLHEATNVLAQAMARFLTEEE